MRAANNRPNGVVSRKQRAPLLCVPLRALIVMALCATGVFAAVGCDLNDPDRDVRRLFPQSSGYTTTYAEIDTRGGDRLLAQVEERLGDRFTGLFENKSVPYTIYSIHNKDTLIGYIHGVNQKGVYGGIQVFLALDPRGTITGFYLQKLTSRAAKKFKDPGFARRFIGLSLSDLQSYSVKDGLFAGGAPPAFRGYDFADPDARAILRAVKKNLILMDVFVFKGE